MLCPVRFVACIHPYICLVPGASALDLTSLYITLGNVANLS